MVAVGLWPFEYRCCVRDRDATQVDRHQCRRGLEAQFGYKTHLRIPAMFDRGSWGGTSGRPGICNMGKCVLLPGKIGRSTAVSGPS